MVAAVALLTLAGCYEMANVEGLDTASDADTDGAQVDSPPGDTDASDTLVPEFFSIEGTLALTAGEVDVAGSSIAIGFWTAREPVCPTSGDDTRGAITLVTAVSEAPPTDVPLLGWWVVELAPGAYPCPFEAPTRFRLGVGEMDSRLYPSMEESGYDAQATASTTYGLYASFSETSDPVFVFGMAGTSGNYDGSVTTVSSGPLPDGEYRLTSLHLLPLPE